MVIFEEQQKIQAYHTAFVEAFMKELAKQLFNSGMPKSFRTFRSFKSFRKSINNLG